MNALYVVPGAHDLTVAELCARVGLDDLVFVPNPGPDLLEVWPQQATHLARRGQTESVEVCRTAEGLQIRVQRCSCPKTAQFALALAVQAEQRMGELGFVG